MKSLLLVITFFFIQQGISQSDQLDTNERAVKIILTDSNIASLIKLKKGYISSLKNGKYSTYSKKGKIRLENQPLTRLSSKTLDQLLFLDTTELEIGYNYYDVVGSQYNGLYHGPIHMNHYGTQLTGNYQYGLKIGTWYKNKIISKDSSFTVRTEEYSISNSNRNEMSFIQHYDVDSIQYMGKVEYDENRVIQNLEWTHFYTEYEYEEYEENPEYHEKNVKIKKIDSLYFFEVSSHKTLLEKGSIHIRDIDMDTIFSMESDIISNINHIYFSKELFVGEYSYYGFKNGSISTSDNYKNGKLNGLSIHYDYTGSPIDSLTYLNDTLDGKAVYYHDNNNIESFGEYLNGNKTGNWTYIDAFGRIISTINYERGTTSNSKNIKIINTLVNSNGGYIGRTSKNGKYLLAINYQLGAAHDFGSQVYSLWDLEKKQIIKQNLNLDIREQFGCYGCDVNIEYIFGMENIVVSNDGQSYYNSNAPYMLYNIENGVELKNTKQYISTIYKSTDFDYYRFFIWPNKFNSTPTDTAFFNSKLLQVDQDSLNVYVLTIDSIFVYNSQNRKLIKSLKIESKINNNQVYKFYKNKLITINYDLIEEAEWPFDKSITLTKITLLDLNTLKTVIYDISEFLFKTTWTDFSINPIKLDNSFDFIFDTQIFPMKPKIISINEAGAIKRKGLNSELITHNSDTYIYNDGGLIWYDATEEKIINKQDKFAYFSNLAIAHNSIYFLQEDSSNLKSVNLEKASFKMIEFDHYKKNNPSIFGNLSLTNYEIDKHFDTLRMNYEFHSIRSNSEVFSFMRNKSDSWKNGSISYFHQSPDYTKSIISFGLNSWIGVSEIVFINETKTTNIEKYVALVQAEKKEFIFYTPDGYYMGSNNLNEIIYFEFGNDVYPFEQFDLKYNRPDIILDRLGYADSTLIEAYHNAYLKRLKKMGFTEDMLQDDFHLPEIKIDNFEEMPTIHDQGGIDIKLNIKDSKYKLDRINVWVNDVAIYGVNGISLRDKNIQEYTTELSVHLAKGKNKVQVSVLNQAGAESYKETLEIECTKGKDKPDLYLITIGESKFKQSDYNLTYAAKDANDMAALFSKSKAYGSVYTNTLVNEQVTKENVLALRSFLEQADINDQVMIFIAGHGVLDANLDYYFATYDMDFTNPSDRGIAYDDLEGLLDGIKPLKKTLIIDACHSGEIDKDEVDLIAITDSKEEGDIQFRAVGNSAQPKLGIQNTSELTKLLFTDLRKGTGATVISSAGGMEFAMESADWNNGLFTYCLLIGITSGDADLNKDGEIWLSELQKYVQAQVTLLSNGKQQPTSRIENQLVDYRVW